MRGSELNRPYTCVLVFCFSKMKLSFRAELAHFAKRSSSPACWREAQFLGLMRVRLFLKLPRWTTTEPTASSYERFLTRNTPCRTKSSMLLFFIFSSTFFILDTKLSVPLVFNSRLCTVSTGRIQYLFYCCYSVRFYFLRLFF